MSEGAEPLKPVEPEEDELRELLEEREQQQAVGWQNLRRTSTKIIDQEDIKFAMELMQFMQGEPVAEKKDAQGDGKSGP